MVSCFSLKRSGDKGNLDLEAGQVQCATSPTETFIGLGLRGRTGESEAPADQRRHFAAVRPKSKKVSPLLQ
jgi:hypothetical protein